MAPAGREPPTPRGSASSGSAADNVAAAFVAASEGLQHLPLQVALVTIGCVLAASLYLFVVMNEDELRRRWRACGRVRSEARLYPSEAALLARLQPAALRVRFHGAAARIEAVEEGGGGEAALALSAVSEGSPYAGSVDVARVALQILATLSDSSSGGARTLRRALTKMGAARAAVGCLQRHAAIEEVCMASANVLANLVEARSGDEDGDEGGEEEGDEGDHGPRSAAVARVRAAQEASDGGLLERFSIGRERDALVKLGAFRVLADMMRTHTSEWAGVMACDALRSLVEAGDGEGAAGTAAEADAVDARRSAFFASSDVVASVASCLAAHEKSVVLAVQALRLLLVASSDAPRPRRRGGDVAASSATLALRTARRRAYLNGGVAKAAAAALLRHCESARVAVQGSQLFAFLCAGDDAQRDLLVHAGAVQALLAARRTLSRQQRFERRSKAADDGADVTAAAAAAAAAESAAAAAEAAAASGTAAAVAEAKAKARTAAELAAVAKEAISNSASAALFLLASTAASPGIPEPDRDAFIAECAFEYESTDTFAGWREPMGLPRAPAPQRKSEPVDEDPLD